MGNHSYFPFRCPSDWIKVANVGCYHFARDIPPTSFVEALNYCKFKGGILAEPRNSQEQTALENLAANQAMDNWWIGATDEAVEGLWKWLSGNPWSYTAWQSGQPNGGTASNCFFLWKGGNYKWADVYCSGRAEYPCRPLCQMA